MRGHGSGKPYDLLNPEQALYTESPGGTLAPAGDAKPLGVNNVKDLRSAVASAK